MAATLDSRPRTGAWPFGPWLLLAVGIALCALIARDGIVLMTDYWLTRPEYSHGILIPFISAYLIWRSRHLLGDRLTGSWLGIVVVSGGFVLWLLGMLSTIPVLTQYALLGMFYGVILSCVGPSVFRRLWAPMLMLFLAIPLPNVVYNNLSAELQLVSSALGVAMLRLGGVSVFLNGNVIDLGHFQMQVVEACDGLRYLFPLMTLGFIVAYFFQAPLWQRVLVFLSSIPITVGMNSLRIAMIGVFADHGNTALAEGLLHDLQGWVIFMASVALMLAEIWLLVRLTTPNKDFRTALGFADSDSGAVAASRPLRTPGVPRSLLGAVVALCAATAFSYLLPERADATPERRWFVDFPATLGEWRGAQSRIEDQYLDVLQLDDYLMADFNDGTNLVNLYAAYYETQTDGDSVHSPRACIPGGGWTITELSQVPVPDGGRVDFRVNRALIQLGEQRQLVYYWFKQRDRELTNEYVVKWYIFVDSLLRRRSDGALVRLVTPLRRGEDVARADERLQEFARTARVEMRSFLPD